MLCHRWCGYDLRNSLMHMFTNSGTTPTKHNNAGVGFVRLVVGVGMLAVGVVGAYAVLDMSPFVAIVVGGAAGSGAAYVSWRILRKARISQWDGRLTAISKWVIPKWAILWIATVGALRFVVGLAWLESVCAVAVLAIFFIAAERHNRASQRRRVS